VDDHTNRHAAFQKFNRYYVQTSGDGVVCCCSAAAELAHTQNNELLNVSEDLKLNMFNVVEKSGTELAVRTAS
jgi:hypothetical protein